MPEFILDTGNTESHLAFDRLPDLCRGYLEAALFCGVTFDADGESVEIDGLGLGNLDPGALDSMVADCVRFQLANAETLARVCDGGVYDLEAAGCDYWFTRNGHAVGFWDRGLGDDGDTLTTACQYDESGLWAAPLDPDTLEPLPGYHVDHINESTESPDPDDPELWRVFLDRDTAPLDETESAALEAMRPPGPDLSRVGSRYGAPLGRPSYQADPGEPATARRVTLDPGGYDAGGAYWGLGLPLWRIMAADGDTLDHIRAATADNALAMYRTRGVAA